MTAQLAHNAGTGTGPILDDRYLLRDVIGRGGMATVYRADDRLLGRTVAVKIFADGPDPADHGERNRAEVTALASLNHPSLVTLFDARLDAEPPYLVMELVDGLPLHERLAEGPLNPRDVMAMLQDLSDALCVVHEAGIVHRDIKPSNVLLTGASGARPFRTKLADFGIAQLADGARLTTPGTLMGTAAYLAPEQVGNAHPAPPADIYALGLVVLECLTGVRAFPGTPAESASARLHPDPGIPESVPVAVRELVRSMTSRSPEARPTARRVHELAVTAAAALETEQPDDALATAPLRAEDLPAPTRELENDTLPADADASRARPRPRLGWVALGVALLLALAAAIATLPTSPANAPTLPAVDEPLGGHLQQLLEAVTP